MINSQDSKWLSIPQEEFTEIWNWICSKNYLQSEIHVNKKDDRLFNSRGESKKKKYIQKKGGWLNDIMEAETVDPERKRIENQIECLYTLTEMKIPDDLEKEIQQQIIFLRNSLLLEEGRLTETTMKKWNNTLFYLQNSEHYRINKKDSFSKQQYPRNVAVFWGSHKVCVFNNPYCTWQYPKSCSSSYGTFGYPVIEENGENQLPYLCDFFEAKSALNEFLDRTTDIQELKSNQTTGNERIYETFLAKKQNILLLWTTGLLQIPTSNIAKNLIKWLLGYRAERYYNRAWERLESSIEDLDREYDTSVTFKIDSFGFEKNQSKMTIEFGLQILVEKFMKIKLLGSYACTLIPITYENLFSSSIDVKTAI